MNRPTMIPGVEPLVEDVERVVLDVQGHAAGATVRGRVVDLTDVGNREKQLLLAGRTVCGKAEIARSNSHLLFPSPY